MNNLPHFNQAVHGVQTWQIPDPGAGVYFSWTVSAPFIVSPTAISLLLTTSATAALRVLSITAVTNSFTPFHLQHSGFVPAGSSRRLSVAVGNPLSCPTSNPAGWLYPLPPNLFLAPFEQIIITLNPMDAADTFTEIYVQARTWLAT